MFHSILIWPLHSLCMVFSAFSEFSTVMNIILANFFTFTLLLGYFSGFSGFYLAWIFVYTWLFHGFFGRCMAFLAISNFPSLLYHLFTVGCISNQKVYMPHKRFSGHFWLGLFWSLNGLFRLLIIFWCKLIPIKAKDTLECPIMVAQHRVIVIIVDLAISGLCVAFLDFW